MKDWLNRLHSLLVEEPTKPSKLVTSTPAVDLPTEPAISTLSTQPPTQSLTVSSSSDDFATTLSSGNVTTMSGSGDVTTTPKNVPSRVLNRVRLVRSGSAFDYSGKVNLVNRSETVWENLEESSVTINTSSGGVLAFSFGAHVSEPPHFSSHKARFLINNRTAFDREQGWGEFYLNQNDDEPGNRISQRPFSFAQMRDLGEGVQLSEVLLQTRTASMAIDGGGMMVAAFPPPAFLNTIRAKSPDGLSSDSPYQNVIHEIEVTSDKALLVIVTNGRIQIAGRGHREQTSLIYTVNGVYDNTTDGRYHATRLDGTTERFTPREINFGFYQLREVAKGNHTVQLEGSGTGFPLNIVTSQVMVIPVNEVQYNSRAKVGTLVTPRWSRTDLITVNVVAVSDSVLVIAASFSSFGCAASSSYQFYLNRERLFPSLFSRDNQLGAWREIHSPWGTSWKVESPGSMLAFARVPKGTHLVRLVNRNDGKCGHWTISPALQVGVVPEEYW